MIFLKTTELFQFFEKSPTELRSRAFLETFETFWPEIEHFNLEDMWFQATCRGHL